MILVSIYIVNFYVFFFKQKTAYEMRISDWSSDVCSSDLMERLAREGMKFTHAYATPVCTPTRVSLITGMNAAHHGITNWTHVLKDTPTDQEDDQFSKIGSASCRERVCQYV